MEIARRERFVRYLRGLSLLKKLFWLYFFLLIFEGALRKWVLPQYSAPLLIIRDPIGVMIIWEAFRTHKWPHRWMVLIQVLTVLLVALCLMQVIAGSNPWMAAAFGLRSYLLPFPVAFIMGENLDQEDIRRLVNCTLFLLLPLTVLAAEQYMSPAASALNVGAYAGSKQISYVGAKVRASGTFSFVIGMSQFGTLAGAFIFYAIFKEEFTEKWLLWASACALMVAIPTIGARALLVQLAAVLGSVIICTLMGVARFGKTLRVILPILLLLGMASFLPVFSNAASSLAERIAGADLAEEGNGGNWAEVIAERTIEPGVLAFQRASDSNSWLGIGMGRGAVAVEALMTGRHEGEAGEDEYSHELVEMGPVGGTFFELLKLFLVIWVLRAAMRRVRDGEPLALLLAPLTISALVLAVPEQPTEQGFMVMALALSVAASRPSALPVRTATVPNFRARPVQFAPRVRPRSG